MWIKWVGPVSLIFGFLTTFIYYLGYCLVFDYFEIDFSIVFGTLVCSSNLHPG
jgi:hypothetical protein